MSVKIPKWLAELAKASDGDAWPAGKRVDVAEEARDIACEYHPDNYVQLLQLLIDEVAKMRRQMDAMVTATCVLGRDLEAYRAIVDPLYELRKRPGATVLIYSGGTVIGMDSTACVITVVDDWTRRVPRTFKGETLTDGLAKAVEAKEAAEKTNKGETDER